MCHFKNEDYFRILLELQDTVSDIKSINSLSDNIDEIETETTFKLSYKCLRTILQSILQVTFIKVYGLDSHIMNICEGRGSTFTLCMHC